MVIKIRSHAFKRFKDLGEDFINDLDQRLLGGATVEDTAKYLREELNVCKDITFNSLAKTIQRYRTSELRNKVLTRVVGAHHGKQGTNQKGTEVATLHKRLNVMDEMEEMVAIQRDRFQKLYMREQQMKGGMLLAQATKEGQVLRGLLMDLAKLQLETGILARAPKRVQGTITTPEGDTVKFEWGEEQEQLFKDLELSLSLSDGSEEDDDEPDAEE